jgi:hypothetical protein
MIIGRAFRRCAALAGLFAVALQALWPMVSHAKPEPPSLLAPVCTVGGVTHYFELSPGKAPAGERDALTGDHCSLCFFGADRLTALPPAGAAFVQVPAFVAGAPATSSAARHRCPTASPAQPRAPPVRV